LPWRDEEELAGSRTLPPKQGADGELDLGFNDLPMGETPILSAISRTAAIVTESEAWNCPRF
jgi:hypothetical protein